MPPNRSRSLAVSLDLIRFSKLPEDLVGLGCKHCHAPMVVHQPDKDFPDRVLGVCAECHCWYALDMLPDALSAAIAVLPWPLDCGGSAVEEEMRPEQ
jgi:hypothetical protein